MQYFMFVSLFTLSIFSPPPQEEAKVESVTFVLEMDESTLVSLMGGEKQESLVPKHLERKLGVVSLLFGDRKNSSMPRNRKFLAEASYTFRDEQHLTILLNQKHLEQMRKLESLSVPIKAEMVLKSVSVEFDISDSSPVAFILNTIGGEIVQGAIVEPPSLKFDSAYGEIEVNWDDVAELTRMENKQTKDDGKLTLAILMKNGDRMTGIPKTSTVTIKTGWGSAIINLAQANRLYERNALRSAQIADPRLRAILPGPSRPPTIPKRRSLK